MNNKYKLKLIHLYPEEMNIYGDMGNIIALVNRAKWRGIDIKIENISQGEIKSRLDGDIYFMGGGQDNDMYKIYDDFIKYKKLEIVREVRLDKVFLLVCGAFQLFGESFLDGQGREMPGINALAIKTVAPGDTLSDRCLGNLATKVTPELYEEIKKAYSLNGTDLNSLNISETPDTLIGFENHSGQTFINSKELTPTGKVMSGKGNNAKDGVEGAWHRNIFGSYMHGSLLPKNPHLADYLIYTALRNRYKEKITLEPLDDTIEWKAHLQLLKKLGL